MSPPYSLTPTILRLCSEIQRLLGRLEGLDSPRPQPKLRRENRIRTIRDTLAIEGNSLSLDQVTALLDEKRVTGNPREIREVQNANRLYEQAGSYDPLSRKDLLKAHGVMMQGLIPDAGKWRSGNVGILKGKHVSHVAPKANRVAGLMEDLFAFLKKDKEAHPLIKSAVFHYELEFIHPFSDGNGRLGRFWQHLYLSRLHPEFEYVPMESMVRDRQTNYYQALEKSDKAGNSTVFIEFSLETILAALTQFEAEFRPESEDSLSRIDRAHTHFREQWFSRKDYSLLIKKLSSATASRDLALAVTNGRLEKKGDRALTKYRYKKS